MSNTVLAIRKSMVILFSFAFIALVLTVVNVGVNESGNSSLSTVTIAKAVGEISMADSKNSSVQVPSIGGCKSGCATKSIGGPSGGSGVGVPVDVNLVKSKYYSCASVDGAGTCSVSNVLEADAYVHEEKCQWELTVPGGQRIVGGPAAVQYLKARLVGNIFNPWNGPERMYNHLTSAGLPAIPWPTAWSDLRHVYNGWAPQKNEPGLSWNQRCFADFQYAHFTTKNTVCYPKTDGRPFPYAVGYTVTYHNVDNRQILSQKNRDWVINYESCVYVSPSSVVPQEKDALQTCYYNLSHQGRYSTSRSAINAGGTPTSVAPRYNGTYPSQPYISGKSVINCEQSLRMDAALSLRDGYAYYRLQGNANFQKYQYYVWSTKYTGGQRILSSVVPAGTGATSLKVYGTNVCVKGSPVAWHQYSSWSALPNITSFKVSDCAREATWHCAVTSPRINNTGNDIAVMRDGSYLPVNLGGVSVWGAGIKDSSTGTVGHVADNNMSYKVGVVKNSSPFSGTNPNTSKQYFELWKSNKTETSWDNWVSQPNTNRNSFLSFYWSSDNEKNWQMTYQAKMHKVEFAVPYQEDTWSAAIYKFIPETDVDCKGVQYSNKVTVLRSVSSEG